MGGEYKSIPKIISVNILYHPLVPDQNDDYIYHGKTDVRGMHTGSHMVARFEPELLPEQCDGIMPEYYFLCVGNFKSERAKEKIDEWMYFFKTESIKDSFTAPGIKAAEKKLGYLKMSEQEQKAYDRYMDELHYERSTLATSIAEGRREGRAEGKLEGKLETAAQMLSYAVSVENISKWTGLPEAEIFAHLATKER